MTSTSTASSLVPSWGFSCRCFRVALRLRSGKDTPAAAAAAAADAAAGLAPLVAPVVGGTERAFYFGSRYETEAFCRIASFIIAGVIESKHFIPPVCFLPLRVLGLFPLVRVLLSL